jgi:hypothetical protein
MASQTRPSGSRKQALSTGHPSRRGAAPERGDPAFCTAREQTFPNTFRRGRDAALGHIR